MLLLPSPIFWVLDVNIFPPWAFLFIIFLCSLFAFITCLNILCHNISTDFFVWV